METVEIIEYYADLLILQYKAKPKAYATIEALVTPVIMDQLPLAVQNAFDPATAIGVQLDIIGKYVGVSRNGFTFSGPITLTDDQYRALITIVIARNKLAATQSAIQSFIHTYFNGVLQEFDNAFMTISYFYEVALGVNPVAEFFITAGFLPRPLGITLSEITFTQPVNNFFAMRTYFHAANSNTAPLNSYSSYLSGRPFLSYANALPI